MSLKQYATETLQADLAALARMWPDGIPPEQNDRVNAIKNELKIRGVSLRPAAQQPRQSVYDEVKVVDAGNGGESINLLSDAALDAEYKLTARQVGDDPGNDQLQDRFATLRFEMRKRAKAKADQPPQVFAQSVIPRDIEMPPTSAAVQGYTTDVAGGTVMLTFSSKSSVNAIIQLATVFTPDEAKQLAAMLNAAAMQARNQS